MCNFLDSASQTVAFLWPWSQEACLKEICVPVLFLKSDEVFWSPDSSASTLQSQHATYQVLCDLGLAT